MNATLATKLDSIVSDFLIRHGRLPAWCGKARTEWQVQAERRLHEKLKATFGKALDRLAEETRRLQFPRSQLAQLELLSDILRPAAQRIPDIIWPDGLEAAGRGRRDVEQALRQAGWRIRFTSLPDGPAELLREAVFQAGQETAARLLTDVHELMVSLADVVQEGAGVDEAARRLRQSFDGLEEHRLKTIARTEINSAQGFGNQQSMVEFGVEFSQWLTHVDDRARLSHIELHGEVVRVTEPFSNGLLYPGDRGGPIREWINCRCRQRPYIPRRGQVITSTPFHP